MIEEIKALKVGPDETLVINVPTSAPDQLAEQLEDALIEVGLSGRVIVIYADGVQFALSEKPAA